MTRLVSILRYARRLECERRNPQPPPAEALIQARKNREAYDAWRRRVLTPKIPVG